jgi:signal transduction histidine kinase
VTGIPTRLSVASRGVVRSLSGQLALLACLAVAPILTGLVVLAVLMVLSDHAVILVASIAVGAAILAVAGARWFSRALAEDLESIRTGLEAVGHGERTTRITTLAADELAAVAQAANAMIERLVAEEAARDASETARRDLVAAVSHDLRTPLTSLRLLADAVGDDVVDGARRRAYLKSMGTQIAALGGLIDDLFELSRLEAGDISWALEQVALDELVDETVEAMRIQAQARGVSVSARLDDRLEIPRGNPEKLQRVLFNLIQNAIHHTPTDGSVVVRAWSAPTGVEIEVADTGEGIPPAERERVFQPFYRPANRSGRAGERAGLGLAVARAIVEAHGGRIWVADSAVGARVRMHLPLVASGASAPAFRDL